MDLINVPRRIERDALTVFGNTLDKVPAVHIGAGRDKARDQRIVEGLTPRDLCRGQPDRPWEVRKTGH